MNLKTFCMGALLAAASFSATAQVSVSIGQPGFYGRVDLGNFAPAPLVYGPPVLVSGNDAGAPVYLRVPPGHRRHWARYCGRYRACGQRVLFVRDDWYLNSYAPRYRAHDGYMAPRAYVAPRAFYDGGRGRWEGHGRGHWEQHGRGHGGHHGGGHGGGHRGGHGEGRGHGGGRGR